MEFNWATGLLPSDTTGGLAGASAPVLASKIKEATLEYDSNGRVVLDEFGNPKVNTAANIIAHVILGAVTAELQGGSALASGVGAGAGEIATEIIYQQMYSKDKDGNPVPKDKLTEAQKEEISALAQLAAGLAGAAGGGGDLVDFGMGQQTGQNAVENNYLTEKQMDDFVTELQSCKTEACAIKVEEKYKEVDQKQREELETACSADPLSATCRGHLIEARNGDIYLFTENDLKKIRNGIR